MLNSTEAMLNHLREASSFLPFPISAEQYDKIGRFSEYLLEVNQTTNLTRITEPRDVAVKHFFDSLAVCQPELFPLGCKVADVGSGAGFPGIPLAILRPDLNITLVDSLRKRTQFLLEVVQRLGLDSVEVVHCRAEDFAQDKRYREQFDVVLARAVASLNILAELCLPLVKVGGMFLAMKGPRIEDELSQARRAIHLLGGGKAVLASSLLPFSDETRVVVKIPKERESPRIYPRKAGTPEKQPLK